MFELLVLLVSTTPLLVGLYALRKINERNDDSSDDQPPPPDPEPPEPSSPPTPRGSTRTRLSPHRATRGPVSRSRLRRPTTPLKSPRA